MIDYKRLTKYKGEPLHTDMEVTDGDEIYERLAELEDLIEQGLLIKLPCKVGDMVWEVSPFDKRILPSIVPNLYTIIRWMEDKAFGKYLFLTKAEAEARLEELKRSKGNE